MDIAACMRHATAESRVHHGATRMRQGPTIDGASGRVVSQAEAQLAFPFVVASWLFCDSLVCVVSCDMSAAVLCRSRCSLGTLTSPLTMHLVRLGPHTPDRLTQPSHWAALTLRLHGNSWGILWLHASLFPGQMLLPRRTERPSISGRGPDVR